MEKEQIRPYGINVLGQWKRYGNVAATKYIQSVFACTSINSYPPGTTTSIMYQQRDTWLENGRRAGKIHIALVGTDASIDECAEWAKQQTVIETIDVSQQAVDFFYKNSVRGPYQKVPRDTYEIDNETLMYQYEEKGRSLHEMAKEYNCTYHNLYNRIRRYKQRNDITHVPRQVRLEVDPIELIRLREVEKIKYKDLAKLYNCSQPTIRNAYIRSKKKLTSKT